MKFNKRIYTAIEKKLAYEKKFSSYVPDEFVIENEDNSKNEYFRKYGFLVPNYVKDLYFKYNGIESNRYIPTDLYLFYVFPILVVMEMMLPYIDKNNYELLFPNIPQPKVFVRNQNDHFSFGKEGVFRLINKEDAIEFLSNQQQFIIKPTNDSGGGKGVRKIIVSDLGANPHEAIEALIDSYGKDFVAQEVIRQHDSLNLLNSSSLNTLRIITYRTNDGSIVSLGAFIRFGKEGSDVDNGGRGGLICRVDDDGRIEDRVFYIKSFQRGSLKELKGLSNLEVPNYAAVLQFCYQLHATLNYFDLCGWDIAIGEDGSPVFIELNQYPDCESFQMVNGPMFGRYTDEVMDKLIDTKTTFTLSIRREFENGRKADFWLSDF